MSPFLGVLYPVTGLLASEWTDEDNRSLEQIQSELKAAKWRDLPE
jgi:hypothetical protein